MTVSYNWLKNYLNIEESAEEVAKILTNIGLEVEGMETVEAIPGGLKGVITAEVLTCEPHPNSDHLHKTTVDTGRGEILNVVCGAPNVAAGQKVLLATIGTVLTLGGEEVKIKKGKIRGEESFGMICAEDELGIGTSHDGIMVLPQDTPIGMDAKDYLHLKSDTIFEIGLTPNRVDASSHLGVVRDLAAWYALQGKDIKVQLPDVSSFKEGDGKGVHVAVEAKEGVIRYAGITLKDVKVCESPAWMKEALNAVGLRPINNVVDITNYILMELGQPLHAFDRDKIAGDKVIVKFVEDGTPFTTLDGVEHKLSSKDVMICNEKEPMCIGGVFGGKDSGVTNQTTSVFLESACFTPMYIRKTSKRHTIKTDASFRFERGTDPNMPIYALKRAALLMQELCGATIVNKITDIYEKPVEDFIVDLNYNRMFSLIGKNIGKENVDTIVKALEMKVLEKTDEGMKVAVPPYRVDVQRECDVVEDVLRLYGYNNIELPALVKASVNHTARPDSSATKNRIADFLADRGFREIMCNSLTKGGYYANLTSYPLDKCVRILNPLSSDLNVMRQTLIFGALETVAYNINRQQYDLKLFETGNVYFYNSELDTLENAKEGHSIKAYSEESRIVIAMTGLEKPMQWRGGAVPSNFFSLKSAVEQIFTVLGTDVYKYDTEDVDGDIFQDGIAYGVRGNRIAQIGLVNPQIRKAFGIKQEVVVAEIRWDVLFMLVKGNKTKYMELPKFPEVKRDLALVVDDNIQYSQLRTIAFRTEKRLLTNVSLFDVYRGDKLPEGKKQYALSFKFRDPEKTLTDAQVEAIVNKLVSAFEKEAGAKLR